ncbi:MAG: hypothetical protein ACTSYO_10260 [Candidatus Ranarchaeia archaeon]
MSQIDKKTSSPYETINKIYALPLIQKLQIIFKAYGCDLNEYSKYISVNSSLEQYEGLRFSHTSKEGCIYAIYIRLLKFHEVDGKISIKPVEKSIFRIDLGLAIEMARK